MAACLALSAAFQASATTVQIQTSLGNIVVNLYDDTTPETVARFLEYVENGDFTDNIIHRSVPGFILQTGGFAYNGDNPPRALPNLGNITNEPVHSNVQGTIAMAKLGGDPNSATRQWFFNLSDNSANLDIQNGGFTVFGQVVSDPMSAVSALAAVPRFNLGGAFSNIPLQDYTDTSVLPAEDQYVYVQSVVVIDAAVDTAQDLDRPLNTLINDSDGDDSDDGGGAMGFWLFFMAGLSLLMRRKKHNA